MHKLHFGHCLGCDHPIRPPYLSFKVIRHLEGAWFNEWDAIDVCNDCAGKLTAEDVHLLTIAREEEV